MGGVMADSMVQRDSMGEALDELIGRLHGLEADEYDAARAAGYPPHDSVRAAFERGVEAAVEAVLGWFEQRGLAELRQDRDEALAEVARLAAELERWPTALTVDGTTGDAGMTTPTVGEL